MNSTLAVIGHGPRTIHLAYYVGENLTGTYCDRAAWETKRVRTMDGGAELATCKRCAKVAADPGSVPNTEARRELVDEVEAPASSGLSHNADACAVRGCVWIDAVVR